MELSVPQTNVLVDDRGQACLADFGLSEIRVTPTRVMSRGLQAAKDFGTARWMSPEVMAGARLTRLSDIYSFAMTMFEVRAELACYLVGVHCSTLRSSAVLSRSLIFRSRCSSLLSMIVPFDLNGQHRGS